MNGFLLLGRPLWQAFRAAQTARALRGFAVVRLLARGVVLLLASHPPTAVVYVGVVVLMGLLPVAQVWLAKEVVDALAAGVLNTALGAAMLYVLAMVVAAGVSPLQTTLADILRDHAFGDVDRRVMEAGTRLTDLHRIERPAFQDERKLVGAVVWQWPILLWLIQTGGGTTLALGGILLLLARLHPLLPVILAALTIPLIVSAEHAHRLRTIAMVRQSRAGREMDYALQLATEPTAAKEVRVFGLSQFLLHRFRDRSQAAVREMATIRAYELRLSVGFAALQALGLAGGFWYVTAQVGEGRLSLGEVALYIAAIAQADSRLFMFSRLFWQMQQARVHLPALFTFLETAGPSITVVTPEQAQPVPATLQSGVTLHRITFRYPEGSHPVLADLSARLPAGKVTALVGANGAGKSTLVKLLTRMYDPTGGEIFLDGVPLWQYDLDSLRGRIAVVYQDFARFSLTLRENIAVGGLAAIDSTILRANARTSDPGRAVKAVEAVEIEAAAHWAGAHSVAAKLPQGYDTPLTRRFAGGVDLSGGEWQKVAIARAFVRNAALVILDEPTAALDADAEYRLFEQFRDLVAGKTALLISHRFSTVRMADHILVLEDGRIVEAGSHEELTALGGQYATLYEMQAGRYR